MALYALTISRAGDIGPGSQTNVQARARDADACQHPLSDQLQKQEWIN